MTRRTLPLATVLGALCASGLAAQEEASRRRVFPVPVLGYAPETSLQIGLAVVGVTSAADSAPATRPTVTLGTATYTLKKQYSLSVLVDRWTRGDGWHLSGEMALSRFPSQFHALGAAASDSSETYTPRTLSLSVAAQRRVAPRLYLGAAYSVRNTRMQEVEPGGILARSEVPGSRGGTDGSLRVEGVWDSRDALYRTRNGGYLRLAVTGAGPALGGDFTYRRVGADARAYRAAGRSVVVAAQAVLDAVDGTAPFEQLPRLGGQGILRGYTEPRFRDDAMAAAQLEVRAPLRGVVSVVAFGGLGATARSVSAIPDSRMRAAGGLGLRILVDPGEGLQLRIDYALAKGGGGLYVAAGDAF